MRVPPRARIQLGNRTEERIEADVRNARVEEAAEALDEAEQLDTALAGAHDSAVNGRVQSRSVAACGQDADAFHATLAFLGCANSTVRDRQWSGKRTLTHRSRDERTE